MSNFHPAPVTAPSKANQVQQPTGRVAIQGARYQANDFAMTQLDGWTDKTLFTFSGPTTDGIQHTLAITVGHDVPFTTVREFAEWQIATAGRELKGCTLLKKGNTALANGTAAYQAIFVWLPIDGLKVYQEQIFVLFEGTAYTLTATFSKKTRKTLGPQVERMMLSFEPLKSKPRTQGAPK